jgi:hypothetical protein
MILKAHQVLYTCTNCLLKAHQVLQTCTEGQKKNTDITRGSRAPSILATLSRHKYKKRKTKTINLRSLEVPALLPAEQRLRRKTLVRERNHHYPPRSQHPRSLCIYKHIISFPVIRHVIWYFENSKNSRIVKNTIMLTIIVHIVINHHPHPRSLCIYVCVCSTG